MLCTPLQIRERLATLPLQGRSMARPELNLCGIFLWSFILYTTLTKFHRGEKSKFYFLSLFALHLIVRYNKNTTSIGLIDTSTRACLHIVFVVDVDSRDASTFDDASRFTTQTYSLLSGLAKRAISPIFVVRISIMVIQKARARAARPLNPVRSLIYFILPQALSRHQN